MRNTFVLTLVATLSLVAVTPARAEEEGAKTPAAHGQVISANPVLLLARWFNADYERRISSTTTWGVSGSYWPIGVIDYARASFLVRYYPQRAALTGFSLGGQSGVYRLGDAHGHEVVYGAGLDVGYAWLLGSKRNIGVSLGFGLTRVFGGDLDGPSFVIPNARLVNVGIAF